MTRIMVQCNKRKGRLRHSDKHEERGVTGQAGPVLSGKVLQVSGKEAACARFGGAGPFCLNRLARFLNRGLAPFYTGVDKWPRTGLWPLSEAFGLLRPMVRLSDLSSSPVFWLFFFSASLVAGMCVIEISSGMTASTDRPKVFSLLCCAAVSISRCHAEGGQTLGGGVIAISCQCSRMRRSRSPNVPSYQPSPLSSDGQMH